MADNLWKNPPAHLFRQTHEPVSEDAELNGVQLGPNLWPRAGAYANPDVTARRDGRQAV